MRFTLAPLVSLLFGASYLIANATAYSYNDYNELDARHQIDDILSERGFGLEARETVDIPFQPSLRAFLEGAVTAHRRSMSEYEEHLEARAAKIDVTAEIIDGPAGTPKTVALQAEPEWTITRLKEEIWNVAKIKLDNYGAEVGKGKDKKPCSSGETLGKCGVKDRSGVIFTKTTSVQAHVPTGGTHNQIVVKAEVWTQYWGSKKFDAEDVKVDHDMMLPAFRKAVEEKLSEGHGLDLNAYEVRLGRQLATHKLSESKTLKQNKVENGSQLYFMPVIEVHITLVTIQGETRKKDMKFAVDTRIPAFLKQAYEELVPGKTYLRPYEARVEGNILDKRKVLGENGVKKGTKIVMELVNKE
ncbi:hypothetical protein D9611_008997 [Ephemerocybe angulata]|uniref:Uncharacterized protein n=1 Tax=Ephemerocybe angulata TaxID=980116 RepID=A0A8H5C0S8_9AGAR|nr:hypothetical protein D9611_008997 [Tulosesus angulatus]